jgi:hypothetical protein
MAKKLGSCAIRLPSGENGSDAFHKRLNWELSGLAARNVGSTSRRSLRCGLRGKPSLTARTRIEKPVEVGSWLKWTHGKRRRTASEQSELHLIHTSRNAY